MSRAFVIFALILVSSGSARAETVYEFASKCHENQLSACFNRIEERLDAIKAAKNGHAYCLPRAWGSTMFESVSYPVSVLEYVRLGMASASFGKSSLPADDVMSSILGEIYPCN